MRPDTEFATTALRPYLTGLLTGEQNAWKERGAPWWDPLPALASFLDGGKALRPRFCYWGYASTGKRPGSRLLRACAALELLHVFALIHDDLMDRSAIRRGRPALHVQMAAQHRQCGWTGDPDAYGQAAALLTGDLAFALATRLAAALPTPARLIWNQLIAELTAGQFLDLAGAARRDQSAEVARTTALLKSGQYTVTAPLRLGAALGGTTDLPAALVRYGDLVGEAFQIRDDLLGVFGDPSRTGKPAGEDLQAGKPTWLVACAAARLPPSRRRLLARAGSGDLTRDEVAELAGLLTDCGARADAERLITRNIRAACRLAGCAGLPEQAVAALRGLARAATDRQK